MASSSFLLEMAGSHTIFVYDQKLEQEVGADTLAHLEADLQLEADLEAEQQIAGEINNPSSDSASTWYNNIYYKQKT